MRKESLTRTLLVAGVALTPWFFGVVLLLSVVSEGFRWDRHAISALSLGEWGWVQRINFVVSGALALASALGLRRWMRTGRGAVAGPLLLSLFGAGLIVSGLYSTDPAFGFPVGAPEGMPPTLSDSAVVHSIGFYCAFTALTGASFVGAWRFLSQGERGWALFSLVTGLITPTLIALGMTALSDLAGIAFALAGLVCMGWLSLWAFQAWQDSRKQTSIQ